ncbi:MAG: asparagine synthase C-terminal domain-containing protein, partial [Nitrososphaerota archaeon]
MLKSDKFGIYILYEKHINKQRTILTDLAKSIRKFKFTDFSPEGITSFLTFRYPVQIYTMFKDYYAIPCGYQIYNNKIKPFWIPKFSIRSDLSLEHAITETERLLLSAVKRLCYRKKRIGVALSGGLDSSLICGMLRSLYPDKKIYTYSAGFIGDDEFKYSRKVSEIFNTIHREIILDLEDFIGRSSLLRPLIMLKGAPLHPNEIALANLERIAVRDGCDIVLCGEGADDVFGGYGQLLRMYLNYSANVPFVEYFLDNYRYFTREEQQDLINEKYLINDVDLIKNIFEEEYSPTDLRDKVFYFIQRIHTPGLVMRAMNALKYNGLPPAFPYLDEELVNFVNSLPFD